MKSLIASRVQMNGPTRFVFKTFWKSASGVSSSGRGMDEMPAFCKYANSC